MSESAHTADSRDALCLVCSAPLRQVDAPRYPWQTYDGCTVEVHGNYGSTVWDPAPHGLDRIYAVICDACLTEALPKVWVAWDPPRMTPFARRVASWDDVYEPKPHRAREAGAQSRAAGDTQ